MAYEKIYSRINWENEPSVDTPLNETNLNREDSAIDILDSRIVAMDARLTGLEDYEPTVLEYMQRAEMAANESESYAVGNTGTRTGEDTDNAKYYSQQSSTSATNSETSKLNSEAYAVGKRNGVDVGSSDETYHNNSKYYSEQSAYSAVESDERAEDSEAWAVGKRNGTDVTSSDETYHNNSKYYAEQSASQVADSEAWAIGKRNGTDVPSTDPAYHNNSKYFKEIADTRATASDASATEAESYAKGGTNSRQGEDTDNANYYRGLAQTSATNASTSESNSEAWAVGQRGGVDVQSTDDTYHNNAKYYSGLAHISEQNAATSEQNASTSETNAATSESNAEDYSLDSQAWSEGKRGNEDVSSTDPQYHNNAKYWAEQAEHAASGGVTSFNGRAGMVEPSADDYSIDQIDHNGTVGQLVTVDTDGKLRPKNAPESGHTIMDEDGTTYPYRSSLQFINADIEDDAVNNRTIISSRGGGGIALDDVSGATISSVKRNVSLTWSDPENIVIDGQAVSTWGGTLVVRKVGSAPTDRRDGTVVLDSKTKNAYSSTPFVDNTVDYGNTYYYRFFPYTTGKLYTDGSSVSVSPTRITVVVPSQNGTLTYDGTEQEPVWNNYDSTQLDISGDVDGTNASTYTATFTPKYDYTWSDGRSAKNVNWTIDKAVLTIPTVTGTAKTYNGTQQSVTVSSYDNTKITVTGISGTTAGNYTVTMSIIDDDNYKWSDGTIADKTVAWTIAKLSFATPVQSNSLVYDGTEQTATFTGYDANYMTVSGNKGTAVNTYTATFTLTDTDNTKWDDSQTDTVTASWKINDATVAIPTVTNTSKTYNGTEQSPTISSYDSALIEITGDKATNAGNYTITMHLKNSNYKWSDNTTVDKTVAWSISPKTVSKPTVSGSYIYDGTTKSATISSFDSNEITQSGTASAKNVGTYTVVFELTNTNNYEWADHTTTQVTGTWGISKATLTVPTVTNTSKTYNGSAQSPTITGFDSSTMTKSGDSATNAGSYTVTFGLVDSNNYKWNSSTTSFAWTINKATVTLPAVTNTSKTYNGSAQSPTIASYDTTKLTVSGNSATNAGNYTVVFSLVDSDNYQMSGTNNVAWSIARATSAITLSTSSVTLDTSHLSATVTVSNVQGRTLSVSSSNTSVATSSVSGSTVTINNVNQANGSATIIVTAARSTNYNASSKSISVTASFYNFLANWLTAGGLNPSSYADLDAVLADEEAIRRLFTIHASVDHLVTYKSQIGTTNLTTILNDDYVAKWINLRDYALDTLYADSTIAGIMDTADKYFYGEWVITDSTTTPATWGAKGNVPVMTSNTAPYGEASGSAVLSSYQYFYAFNQVSGGWYSTTTTGRIQYKFTNPICVKKVAFLPEGTGTNCRVKGYQVVASNDGSNWKTLAIGEAPNTGEMIVANVSNNDYYLYYGINVTSIYGGSYAGMNFLQFYGRELKMSVPTMTSDTAPYGEASASSLYSTNYAAWHAFAGVYWNGADNTSTGWIQYKFINPMIIKYWTWKISSSISDAPRSPKTYDLQGSNDGVDWEIIETYTNTITTVGKKITYNDVNNDKPYKYYRVNIRDLNGDKRYCIMGSLQFYGLDYSEYDWDTDNPRHYIYDHGVEPSGTISGGTKGEHALTLSAVGTATLTTDTTSYTAMGGKAGMMASGTNALKCGSATSNFTATNMPYGNGIDITSVNGSNAVGIAQTSAGTFDAEEVWIA